MKPREVLTTLLSIYAGLAVLMYTFPSNGIGLGGGVRLQFVSPSDFFSPQSQAAADISNILAQSDALTETSETTEPVDSNGQLQLVRKSSPQADTVRAVLYPIEFPASDPSVLYPFWDKLALARGGDQLLRILHYGDSQIEADRISAYLRNKLQTEFGGSGPGFRPLRQAFDFKSTVKQENTGSWYRYAGYGLRDSLVGHNRYGAYLSFARFSPLEQPLPATAQPEASALHGGGGVQPSLSETQFEARVDFSRSNVGYVSARRFRRVRLFYGYNSQRFDLVASSAAVELSREQLPADSSLHVREWVLSDYADQFSLQFKGTSSPELYGITLDDKQGVALDNIALRGSSGTEFLKVDAALSQAMYKQLGVSMVILQFGGNVTPYMRDKYDFYEKAFYNQLIRLKRQIPGVAIVVIGPADMSRKEKDTYVSYENIPDIRDALRRATFKAGGAFWDMYQAMGGRNSMPAWVNNNPPLAEKDFVHFNPKGANVIAEMFYKAFIDEYRQYQRLKSKKGQ